MFLMRAVGLAAIGTVADVVPLVDENRILVRHGLNCLRHYPTPGLLALEQVTGLDKKPHIECEDVAFTIAPRLNAAGRLGQAPLALELLITESPERARKLAEFIHSAQRTAADRWSAASTARPTARPAKSATPTAIRRRSCSAAAAGIRA